MNPTSASANAGANSKTPVAKTIGVCFFLPQVWMLTVSWDYENLPAAMMIMMVSQACSGLYPFSFIILPVRKGRGISPTASVV